MRSVFVVVAVYVALLLLFSSGSVSGEVCVANVGCLRGDDRGFRIDESGAARGAVEEVRARLGQ